MKRLVPSVALLAIVAAAPALATPAIIKDGELNVCTTAGFPPMTYKNDPSDALPVGIDIDIVNKIAERWAVSVVYTVAEFSAMLPTLGSGRCDMIASGIYVTDKRREVYDAVKYMRSATVIITQAGSDSINAPEDLSGRELALESGTYYGEVRVDPLNAELTKAGKTPVNVTNYPSQQAAYQQVMVGRADATLTEEAEGAFRVAQTDGQLRIAYTWPSEFSYGFYVRRDDNDIAPLREIFKTLDSEGFFDELSAKWGVDPSVFDVDYDS